MDGRAPEADRTVPVERAAAITRVTGGHRVNRDVLRAVARDGLQCSPRIVAEASSLPTADELLSAAAFHRVTSFLHILLTQSNDESVPEHLRASLRARYLASCAKQLLARAEMARLTRAFAEAGVAHTFLKGVVLGNVYPKRELRDFNDVDVLVAPRDADRARSILLDTGAVELIPITEVRQARIGQQTLVTPAGVPIDLHWELFSLPEVRDRHPVSAEALLEGAITRNVAGTTVPVLPPESALWHLACHAAFSGGNRLVWFMDMKYFIAMYPVDWDVLMWRADTAGLGLVTASMLERAKRVVGAKVPMPALDGMARRWGWRGVMRGADAVRPVGSASGGHVTGEVLSLAMRRTSSESSAALMRSLWTSVLRPLMTDPDHPWRRPLRKRLT